MVSENESMPGASEWIRKVVVVVRGGVAEVDRCPQDVEVEIRDYDNGAIETECAADDADEGPF